jgi:hypothetical protein
VRVVRRCRRRRALEVTPFAVGKLSEDAGLDGWTVLGRMVDAGNEPPGYLDGLAAALDLSAAERMELALAYSMEQRRQPTA